MSDQFDLDFEFGDESLVQDSPPEKRDPKADGIDLKNRVQQRLLSELDYTFDPTRGVSVRAHIEELFNAVLAEESLVMTRAERQRLFESVVTEILGFGPLEVLLADDMISAIMVNNPKTVFVVQRGRNTFTNVVFDDEAHLRRIMEH